MEPEQITEQIEETSYAPENNFHKITPLSKYLALALFVLLPFVGGWVGYQYAPEKIVEIERVVEVEKVVINEVDKSPSTSDVTPANTVSYVSIKENQDEYSIYDSINIAFNFASESVIDTSEQKRELYLIDDSNTLQRFITEVDFDTGNIEFTPEHAWRNAGLDIVADPPKTGNYRVLLLARESIHREPGPYDYPVDTLDNPYTVYKDGFLVNSEATKHGIAPTELLDSAVSEVFHITNPIVEKNKG
ncbi:hypothetical protein KC851_00210 [Candidatus Kaiserbacteria bacterium]|nr:hypothetical protein [Candidatus Kaiserbacteria bacterium]